MGNDIVQAHAHLYNPLLDALLNPAEKTPLRSIIAELARAHSDYTILVPPASVLHNCTDFGRQRLVELCYTNDEFVKSHIIRTTSASPAPVTPSSKQHSLIYSTMNGKQILLKNKAVFTGKGFKNSLKVSVTSVGHMIAFSPPFRKGSSISLIYIEASLYGPKPTEVLPSKDLSTLNNMATSKTVSAIVTFEDLLRKYPVLSRSMSPSFYALFHHNNREFEALRTHRKLSLMNIKQLFNLLVHKAVQIVQDAVNTDSADGDRIYNLLQSLSTHGVGLDMDNMIHEYVELNMYDHVWSSLVFQYKNIAPGDPIDDLDSPKTVLTQELYRDLSCLSLNQLDIPVIDPWNLNILHRRVADAIKIFASLSDPAATNQKHKLNLIKETVSTLTAGSENSLSGPVIDADTLIGLLIMVVVHSKVANLECHMFYIRHFGTSLSGSAESGSAISGDDMGLTSYILSNIEAVIFHLHNTAEPSSHHHIAEMSEASAHNYRFWYAISRQDECAVKSFLDEAETEYRGKELPRHHTLRSRNINGESCFFQAIKARSPAIFSMLLDRTEEWILLEDLLFDKNTSTNQNLLMFALQEEVSSIVHDLIDVLLVSATYEEQVLYLNSRDSSGRTVGHYLSHDLTALERLGSLINWEAKDANTHTPLFTFCRYYDHPDYNKLIAKSFQFVSRTDSNVLSWYDAHTDKTGNTLLHALARAIPESGLLSESQLSVNVNQMNKKGVTPAALYVRYNRLANLEHVFKDSRLIFDIEEPNYYYNLMDYYSFSASKSLSGPNEEFSRIEDCVAQRYFSEYFPSQSDIQIGFVNAKFDASNSDWAINTFHCRQKSKNAVDSNYISLDRLRQFYKLERLTRPMTFFPPEDIFWMNFVRGKPTVPICSKYKSNRMLEHLSMFFALSNFLRPDGRKQFMKMFARCCKEGSASGLDLMSEISVRRESLRNEAGYVKLTESHVQEILFFIEYSITDLSKHREALCRLNRISALASSRQRDDRNVTDQFFNNISGLQGSRAAKAVEFRRLDGTYDEMQKYVGWIELCTDELIVKCNSLVEKTRRWHETYAKIRMINSELHKFEDLVLPHKSPNSPVGKDDTNVESIHGSPQGRDVSLLRRNTLSVEELPLEAEQEDSSFFSFGLVDSKKSRYKKLVLAKSEEVKRLMDFNVDIKLDHEALAAEISQFLEYRSAALKFGVRQFVNRSMVVLKDRQYELSKLLNHAREK